MISYKRVLENSSQENYRLFLIDSLRFRGRINILKMLKSTDNQTAIRIMNLSKKKYELRG